MKYICFCRLFSAQSETLKEFVVTSETTFIIERLEFMTSKQIVQTFTTTLRHLNEYSSSSKQQDDLHEDVKYIFTEIRNAFKMSHFIDFNHKENCDTFILNGKWP